jgi:ABC-type Fe3+ transport system substrate-binding protein
MHFFTAAAAPLKALCRAPAFLAVLLAVSVHAAAADPNAEWAKTAAGAAREGKLAVFLYQRDNIEAAIKVFEKQYPDIQLTIASVAASETGPRLMAERRAGKFLWDVCICGPTTPFSVLYPAKGLDPIKPALVLPEVLDESKWWSGKHSYMDPQGQYIFVFLGSVELPNVYYNKTLADPKDFRSYWDLTNPRWRGKILALDPRNPGRQRVGARFLYNLPDLGAPFLTKLFTEMDVTLSRDDRQAMDWLAVGKFPLCLFCGNIDTAKAQSLPVEEFKTYTWKEGAAIYSGSNGTVALMSNAPHPNAARLFINWLLSRDGQTSFQKIMNTPDLVMESLRVDISKDPIPAEKRRKPGVNYILMDTPERSNQEPVSKLLKNIIKQ